MDESILQNLVQMVRESPIGMGLRSTWDAAQQDFDDIGAGRLPRQLLRAGEQAISAYNNPIGGVVLPRIPKYTTVADKLISGLPQEFQQVIRKHPGALERYGADATIPTGEYDTMLGTILESPTLGGIGQRINSLRKLLDELAERSAKAPGVAGVKTMKPGPSTLEGLIKNRAKAQEGIGGRSKLRPAIRYRKTGEVFGGEVGKNHPSSMTTDTLTRREGRPIGMDDLEYGFQIPGEEPFIPEPVAQYISFPEGAMKVADLLSRGIKLDTIVNILRQGKLPLP
jgi:hypothetical protein